MKHNWSRGMELPICIVCGLSPIAAHLWGDDDWKQFELPECPGFKLPRFVNRLLNKRRPSPLLITIIRWLAMMQDEARMETISQGDVG